jgi:putative spermidine/putrescine transport system ATP-binding protein
MSGLDIRALSKRFNSFTALNRISLSVAQGQFVCLLGPSGCGKSTLLRIIAGLDTPSEGQILIDGQDIAGVPAHQRDFGMVFQSLALFPHLSVAENIAYPLAIRGVDKAKQAAEVARLLDLVHLPGMGGRAITQLSGGQRQRVAIARALVMTPRLFLLDEPMSALDAKLREAMQIEVKRLQRQLGVTSILVTHDQREAMTTADLVVVMSGGVIQQAAAPLEIYRNPANAFVADFIGITNLIDGQARGAGRIETPAGTILADGARDMGPVTLSVRPEDLALSSEAGEGRLSGTVSFIRRLGAVTEVSLAVPGMSKEIVVSLPGRQEVGFAEGAAAHVVVPPSAIVILPGAK